jgi:hypothetical protein
MELLKETSEQLRGVNVDEGNHPSKIESLVWGFI